jgi:hypothetical protein
MVFSDPFHFRNGGGALVDLIFNDKGTELGSRDGLGGSKKKVFQGIIVPYGGDSPGKGLSGTEFRNDIVVKRFYDLMFSDAPFGSGPAEKYARGAEVFKACTLEANTTLVASALMQLAYDAVKRAETENKRKPPHPIPTFPRFAHSAILLGRQEIFLGEEFIPNFRKFVPTQLSGLVPTDLRTDIDKCLASFFTALQHIQYLETNGLAFVADFQGNETVLSDLKVLVDP